MSARESEEVRVFVAEKCSLGRIPGTEMVTLKLIGEMQDRLSGTNRDSLASLEQPGQSGLKMPSPSLPHVFSCAQI
jgi:hypothetical protein